MDEHPTWNPRPSAGYGDQSRRDYFAGYSDGYYNANYGAGHDSPTKGYDAGYRDGRWDVAAPARARTASVEE